MTTPPPEVAATTGCPPTLAIGVFWLDWEATTGDRTIVVLPATTAEAPTDTVCPAIVATCPWLKVLEPMTTPDAIGTTDWPAIVAGDGWTMLVDVVAGAG